MLFNIEVSCRSWKKFVKSLDDVGYQFQNLIPAKSIIRIFLIDIKVCLVVIGNYGRNFRPNPKRNQTQPNFPGVSKWKMETLVFSLPLKKSKLFSIFFLLMNDILQMSHGIIWYVELALLRGQIMKQILNSFFQTSPLLHLRHALSSRRPECFGEKSPQIADYDARRLFRREDPTSRQSPQMPDVSASPRGDRRLRGNLRADTQWSGGFRPRRNQRRFRFQSSHRQEEDRTSR